MGKILFSERGEGADVDFYQIKYAQLLAINQKWNERERFCAAWALGADVHCKQAVTEDFFQR
jgi:hypothetical protein